MMKIKYLAIFASLSLILTACGEQKEEKATEAEPVKQTTETAETALPPGHPSVTPAQTPQQGKVVNSGIVKEVFSGGGYTYAAVDVNGKVVWVAGPASNIEVGSTVGWKDASLMENFSSPSLNKTFDQIYFVSGFVKPQQVSLNKGQVEESIASAGYLYIKVKTETKTVWLAAPETTVANGETVQWEGGAVMRNFKSNTLERIFEEIIFVDKIIKG